MGLKVKKRRKITSKLSKAESRYRFKPGFSDKVKERSRKVYRSSKGKDFELEGGVVLRALEFLDAETKPLPVLNQLTNRVEVLPVLRLMYAAKLLNVSYQTLWRWTSETQQVPMPVLVDTSSGREYAVYHVEEIRVMIRIIGDHLTRFKYYRSDHEATKKKLFAEIEALRALNFNKVGEPNNGDQKQRPQTSRKSVKGRTRIRSGRNSR